MKYAVVKTGGKQYKVSEGDVVVVERLSELTPASDYIFEDVLLYVSDSASQIGAPRVDGVVVKGTVEEHIRGEKIRVSKFKAKAKYRRVTGHRQALTRIKISEISSKDDKSVKTQTEVQPAKEVSTEKAVRKPRATKAK